jgi:hypothetical protein
MFKEVQNVNQAFLQYIGQRGLCFNKIKILVLGDPNEWCHVN